MIVSASICFTLPDDYLNTNEGSSNLFLMSELFKDVFCMLIICSLAGTVFVITSIYGFLSWVLARVST